MGPCRGGVRLQAGSPRYGVGVPAGMDGVDEPVAVIWPRSRRVELDQVADRPEQDDGGAGDDRDAPLAFQGEPGRGDFDEDGQAEQRPGAETLAALDGRWIRHRETRPAYLKAG